MEHFLLKEQNTRILSLTQLNWKLREYILFKTSLFIS